MNERRMEKLDFILKELPPPKLIGPEAADLTVVSWCSNKEAIIEAISMVKDKTINFLSIKYLSPFQKEVDVILKQAKKILLIEANYSGQLGRLIREKTGIKIENKMLGYDGRVFTVEDIFEKLNKKW